MSDRFEVRAVCAQVSLQAERAAQEFDAEAVDGYRAMVSRDDVDAILMLSPQWFGPLPILAACDAGKAVYCASVLDLELEQARQVRHRVDKAGIAFMAELPRRHAAATLRLKELIATRLGRPKLIFCHRRKLIPDSTDTRRHTCTGALVRRDLIELVDWCRYVMGQEPSSVVSVRYGPGNTETDSHYRMLSLDFSNGQSVGGPMAQISCGHYMPAEWTEAISFRPPAGLQVCCENGVAFVDLPTSLVWFDEAGRHMESLETERPVGEQLLALFHRAVTSLVRKTNDLEDAYRALSAVIGAEKSERDGLRIRLDL
jgi:predicted dehydrogenase